MTKKQDAMLEQGNKGRTYAGFNERWDEKHPDLKEPPQEEQLFDPDGEDTQTREGTES